MIKFVTYNILADAYLNPAWYEDVDPSLLQREHRIPALLQRISSLQADILCLQEVELHAFEAISQRLSTEYEGEWAQKGSQRPDGCALFWRRAKLTRAHTQNVYYQDAPKPSGHVAQTAILSLRDRSIGVINTHLRWDDPTKEPIERWCYRQAREIVSWSASYAPAPEAWIFCGDLNVTPQDAVIGALLEGGFQDVFLGFDDAHTCLANRHTSKIDHILYTKALVATPKRPPSLAGVGALPSAQEPSDHIPLECTFSLEDSREG